MRTLRSGVVPRQRHEHAGSVQSSGQMRSDGRSKRATRSGLNVTAARADRAEEALVERPRRQRQRAREASKMRLQRGERLTQQHEHAGRVRTSKRERLSDQSKKDARSGEAVTTAQADSADTASREQRRERRR